ncbi:MAG: FUSC family protein [Novosphingobium sp.]|nr:MAG: FUSC family protein [Novosphingobium sp.]
MADELECVASVLLAIVIAHLVGAEMIAWAAFSAFVLLKGPVGETLVRAVLRMIGTFLGATLAIWFERMTNLALWQIMLAVALVGGVGLYGMLTAKRAYAFLLFGLTFLMIVLDRMENRHLDIEALALTRVLEVGAGTLACVIVSVVSTLTARRWWPASLTPSTPPVGWHPDAARHAVQAAIALSLLPVIHLYWDIPELAQAGVTIMAVMIVPVAGLGSSGLAPVSRRLRQRAVGCLAGGLLAAAILYVAHGSVPLLVAGTCLGIVLGRHIENGSTRNAYLGLQFTLAVLVVLVPDDYANVAIEPGLERMVSVFIGMAILVPILVAGHLIAPERAAADTSEDTSASE